MFCVVFCKAKTVSTNLEEAEDVLQEDEVQYASVNIQPKKLLQM